MSWTVDIEHIAGILDGSARVEPGLNAVRASNWQGKSSFVEAIKTALGVSATLTEGSDHGSVSLRTPDREYHVELTREKDTVHSRGEPLLAEEYDRIRASLFACLDEDNELRRTVRRGENLESALLRPLDFQNIDQRIGDLKHEREQVESELAGAKEAKRRLPTLTERVQRLESELSELQERHESLTDDGEAVQSTQSELAEAQSERDQAQSRVEQLERSVERVQSRLEERRTELAALDVDENADVAADLESARDELSELRRDVEVLQSVHSATEMVLTEDRLDLVTDVQRGLTGDSVACWTCGSTADRSDIEDQLDDLGERIAQRRATVESLRDEVERLEARREEHQRSRRRKQDLQGEVADLEERLADHRQDLEDARQRLETAESRVTSLSETVDETVAEVTDVESEIKYREAELADARDEQDSLETRAERVDDLEAERERIDEEIEELRNRKDEIKFETRAAFDDAIGDVLDRFDTGFETARLTPQFELVVARDGQEASLNALSEGELELLGFVTALAGHAAFEVAETVPVMLVDGVGGLDDANLHTLIEYLEDRAAYLVFTIYPEYTAFEGHEIDPGTWTIASIE